MCGFMLFLCFDMDFKTSRKQEAVSLPTGDGLLPFISSYSSCALVSAFMSSFR